MTKKHLKHTQLTKPNIGHFGRNELSILGCPCDQIKELAGSIRTYFLEKYSIAYVDADHKKEEIEGRDFRLLSGKNNAEYTDKIDFQRLDVNMDMNPFTRRSYFKNQDFILINGNHFESDSQILVIHPKKTLEKKLHKLTHVKLIILFDENQKIPEYLVNHISELDQIPMMKWHETSKIIHWIEKLISQQAPKVKGLVLSGGKSVRMKRDKNTIKYHQKNQKEHMHDMLSKFATQTFYSISNATEANVNSITDTFTGLGPYGAILSAFRQDPNVAWLVTACDQPFLKEETIQLLMNKRNPSKVATAFYNPDTDFPEPLVTIWEPKAYVYMLDFLSQGYSCPRKVLINTDIELVQLEDSSVLRNVNTPEEFQAASLELGMNSPI